ncbi:hypothetical protein ACN2XU_09035 [Primorskyibacter sp. 2E107]|uniref:hypothetical protein n=1 Tax=Primorskyibacter sp. 2E107 TaxID=3403458 RepID=UPI003AF8005E
MSDTRINIGRLIVQQPGTGRQGQSAFAEALAAALRRELEGCPAGAVAGISLQVSPDEARDPAALARRIAADVRRRIP